MKKSVLFLATAALFAACARDSVRENIADDQVEIGFSTYIQKPVASKADNSTATALKGLEAYHQNFVVNGFKTVANNNPIQVFEGQEVTAVLGTDGAATGAWTYSPVSYWDKSAAHYSFYAAAPQRDDWAFANNAYSIPNFTAPGTSLALVTAETPNAAAVFGEEDLMIATDIDEHKSYTSNAVNFTFNHILSRLNIAISTSIADGTVTLTSLTVNGIANKGNFDELAELPTGTTLAGGTTARWEASGSATLTAVKGAEGADVVVGAAKQFVYQGLVIPQVAGVETINLDGTSEETEPYLKIQYTITTGGSNTQSYSYFYNLADLFNGDTDADLSFNEGWQNNLYITIGAAAISFDADVYEWATQTSGGSLEVQ